MSQDETKPDLDKKLMPLIAEYYSLHLADGTASTIDNYRKPYNDGYSIEMAKLWMPKIKQQCQLFLSKNVHAMRAEFPPPVYSYIRDTCTNQLFRNKRIENDEKFSLLVEKMQKRLDSYRSQLESAQSSSTALGRLFSDPSSKSYHDLRALKAKLKVYVKIHEILVNNENSKKWRKELDELNQLFNKILKDRAIDIANNTTKFNKPGMHQISKKMGDELSSKILTLFNQKYNASKTEIIIADNALRASKYLKNLEQGVSYKAIAFYALEKKANEKILRYGWYQKNESDNQEFINITETEVFLNPKLKNKSQKKETKILNEDLKNDAKSQSKKYLEDANKEKNRILDKIKKRNDLTNNSHFSLLGFISSILMIVSGLFILRNMFTSLLPNSLSKSLTTVLNKISPFMTYVGFILIILGLYSLLINVLNLSIIYLLISLITIGVGLYLSIENIHQLPSNFKGKEVIIKNIDLIKNQTLLIGIFALIIGFYQLFHSF